MTKSDPEGKYPRGAHFGTPKDRVRNKLKWYYRDQAGRASGKVSTLEFLPDEIGYLNDLVNSHKEVAS